MIKVYEYSKCSTCQKALKALDAERIEYERFPIVEIPPSKIELRRMLDILKARGGSFKNLFNTAGIQYRELKISDRIKGGMTEAEAIDLLSKNGKLIKRPFILGERSGIVGFPKDGNFPRS